MSETDPAMNPDHDLDVHPQDPDVDLGPGEMELRRIMLLLRVAAGVEGSADISWQAAGFLHTLSVIRLDE